MKSIFTLICFLFFAGSVLSQISLSVKDFPVAGIKYFEALKNQNLGGLTHGKNGIDLTWDFSNLTSNTKDTSTFIASGSVSKVAPFENCNVAQEFKDGYEFYNYNNELAALCGFAKLENGEYLRFDLQNLPLFHFPATPTENNYHVNTRVSFFKTNNRNPATIGQVDSLQYKITYTQSMEIKGWGKLKTPMFEKDVLKAKFTTKYIINYSSRNKATGSWVTLANQTEAVSSKYSFYANGIGIPTMIFYYADSTDTKLTTIAWYTGQNNLSNLAQFEYLSDDDYTISPNPSAGGFDLKAPNISDIARVSVLDILGKEIPHLGNLVNGNFTIDAPNGIYNVNLYTNRGIIVKRVMIQK